MHNEIKFVLHGVDDNHQYRVKVMGLFIDESFPEVTNLVEQKINALAKELSLPVISLSSIGKSVNGPKDVMEQINEVKKVNEDLEEKCLESLDPL